MSYSIDNKEQLEGFICKNWNELNSYIAEEMIGLPVPFYSSVDIRESKSKYAPVDLNFYPAGFNNLCQLDLDASLSNFEKTIKSHREDTKNIAIIVESHTKNLFYLDHLAYLKQTLSTAGYHVHLASFDQNLFPAQELTLELISKSKFDIIINKMVIDNNLLYVAGEQVDLAIMNNDQSNPIEIDWKSIQTAITPSPLAGWFKRTKAQHFLKYKEVVLKFSEKYSINPTLLMADFIAKDGLDFLSKDGLESLGQGVDELLKRLPEGTKAFVKADQGTYGMGISVVSSGEEIVAMNRKNRNKMDIGKNKIKFTSAIIQEGVESVLTYDGLAAEVTIYLVGGCPIGGFVRANEKKGAKDNLNSQGMVFKKYCISEIKENSDHQTKEAAYAYIARLSTLAGALEIKDISNQQ